MTINLSNWNRFDEILSWLQDDLAVPDFKANPVTAVGRGRALPDLTPIQVFAAQTAILDYMAATRGLRVIEDNLSTELIRLVRPLAERRPNDSLCRSQSCGAGRAVLGITPDGALLPCGRFQWDETEYFLGHLHDDISEKSQSFEASVERFHALVPGTWHDCASCSARHICSYGCQAFISRSPSHANVECLPTKMRYQYLCENWSRFEELATNLIEIRAETLLTGFGDNNYSDKYTDDKRYRDYSDYKDYTDKGPGKS